jgi:isoquinoline 1-oxidoreductase beta subunit
MNAPTPSRRAFLRNAAGAGVFTLGATVPFGRAWAQLDKPVIWFPPYDPNVFLQISKKDNTVTLICKHLEMGQGVTTGLATLVAEELDADWDQMRFAFAPADAVRYRNLRYVVVQATGGSTSTSEAWMQMRQVGAAARAMFVKAAADEWNVRETEIVIKEGVVSHGAKTAKLGEFADAAMRLSAPLLVKLKDPKDWRLIRTTERLPRLDSAIKTNGKATFALDVCRSGLLTVMVRRPDVFGATVASYDASETRKIAGVVHVRQLPSGIAVYATNTWAAIEGRKALKVDWDRSSAETRSTEDMFDEYRGLLAQPGEQVERRGNAAGVLAHAEKTGVELLDMEFKFPFLAHAPMEPLNCTVELSANGAEICAGSQVQTIDHLAAAFVLGLEPEQVKINTLLAGGSFGRRGNPSADWIIEACHAAKAIGGRAPVHLVWTREDDIKGGFYRPMVLHRVRVRTGLTAQGELSGWQHQIVSKSIFADVTSIKPIDEIVDTLYAGTRFDSSSTEGVKGTPYAIEDFEVRLHNVTTPVPVTWWRSVGNSHTAFVMETVIDELAERAKIDKVAFRLRLLARDPRAAKVISCARDKSGWTSAPTGNGRGHGIAFHCSFGTRVAMVAEVTVNGDTVKVDRIVTAVDVGIAVNPDLVKSQVEGAVGFALSMVLRNQITLRDGVVQQSNFDDYEPTRMRDMPKVEVHIVPSDEDPTGIGEPAVPVVAPAIGNAIFAATGKRHCALPFGYRSIPLDYLAGNSAKAP